MSENLHAMDDDTLQRYAEWLGVHAATLRGLRDGSLVAVPREPTRAMVNRGLENVYINWREASEEMALSDDEVKHIYNLMLAAAQEPQHDR